MSGISYTPPGVGTGLMTTFSGTFTTLELNSGANSPLFPGVVTQIYFNITANPTWPANLPRVFFTLDIAISANIELILPAFAADPFNLNFTPVDLFTLGQPYYTQSFASSFLSVSAGAGGLVGTVINYTALCWQP